ncbi:MULTISPECIES: beta-propeller domain-containing protein [unclassified Fusibacter]|uniref:beta-propeller domain-containing protein n=1 Tax=unclassified Fusibacter TaxID=2624464 RepID=UPI0010105D4F|nr:MULTISPECIES: beta-propeller domain-containing protein [unclassified Fusibacter]MCK8058326.1 beta-propeller domain-containing protein [Fusibacter sp. A2]NPE20909.1 hypothetical protein [Fusibacter sp. A1]RXV63112.1 hypothetical protein DWB64_03670 [Fusibacter sp. A1]
MKKMLVAILMLLMVIAGVPLGASADSSYVDVPLKISLSKDYLPLRSTFEGLGYTVTWQAQTRMVEIEKNKMLIQVKADQKYLLKNGVLVDGIIKPVIIDGRMYLSVAAVNQIFEGVRRLNPLVARVYDTLRSESQTLPVLHGMVEYDALMSFYPSEDLYYRMLDDISTDEVFPAAGLNTEEAKESDVSETNNQVEGVDEADLVKLDEHYIYALKNQLIQIIKTGRGKLQVAYMVKEDNFYPEKLFITEDRLIVIGRETSDELRTYEKDDRIMTVPLYRSEVMMIKVYDKTNLAGEAPRLIKSFGVEGRYLSGRLVDRYIYVVANRTNYYDQIRPMPQLFEKDAAGKTITSSIGYDELAYFPGHVNNSMMYTIGLDLDNLSMDGFDVDAYIGGGSSIYVDQDSLYVAQQQNSGMWWRTSGESTDIFKFELLDGSIDFDARGSVPGSILNQFSMDEYGDHFRITTTRWGSEDAGLGNTTLNNLYILDEELNIVGRIENLAPGERIYSTRMIAEKVYMVTYRQVDPFYVIDTSDAQNPKVLGYLKIPGYSSYLHPYDQTTIIGVGMNTKLMEGRVVNDGVKISLFDVSDFEHPIEKDKRIIGSGNSSTDVQYDHKAFLFNKDKSILAIPVTVENNFYGGYSKDAYVFGFTEKGMLDFKGSITHSDQTGAESYGYDYNSQINRIMYVDEDLYTLSYDYLKLNDLKTLEEIDVLKR